MMIVDSKTMAQIDAKTIKTFMPGEVLMENAGKGAVYEILKLFDVTKKIVVLIGPGNNGGDGFVIARLLLEKNYDITTLVLCKKNEIKSDSRLNFEKLSKIKSPIFISHLDELKANLTDTSEKPVLIDALFGTGLNRDLSGLYKEAIDLINSLNFFIVSIDIPSGVRGDDGLICAVAVKANLTLTFGLYKFGHFIHPGKELSGEVKLIDIGIPKEIISAFDIKDKILTSEVLRPKFLKRESNTHKYNYGHAVIVAGSQGKTGAALLTAKAALKAGAGLVTLLVPDNIYELVASNALEIMVEKVATRNSIIDSTSFIKVLSKIKQISVVAAGPGIGINRETEKIMDFLLTQKLPLILDADALTLLKNLKHKLKKRSSVTILTPHLGEFSKLIEKEKTFVLKNKLNLVKDFSKAHLTFTLLKGNDTLISSPEGSISINISGSPAMANAGQGDALTGFIAGLFSSGYSALEAIEISASLQGRAADYLSDKNGPIGVLASEIIEIFPSEYKKLFL